MQIESALVYPLQPRQNICHSKPLFKLGRKRLRRIIARSIEWFECYGTVYSYP